MHDVVLLTFPRCGSNFLVDNMNRSHTLKRKISKTHDIEFSKKYGTVITIIRNPYDSIISTSVSDTWGRGGFQPSSVPDNIIRYIEMYNYLLSKDDVYFISFDKLISEPKKVIKDLCEYLGQTYTDVEIKRSLTNISIGFLESGVGQAGYEEAKSVLSRSHNGFIECERLYELAIAKTL